MDSPIRRLDAAKQKLQRHACAFTFYCELAIFSCLARKVHRTSSHVKVRTKVREYDNC